MTDEQRVSGERVSGEHLPGEDDRARLERLAAIFEHSTDAIVGKTLDGTITDWNAAAERAYGWRTEEAVGRHISMVFPPDRQQELADILGHLRRGEEMPPHETERLRKDGSLFRALVTVSPIRDHTGRAIAGSKTALDLTEVLRRQREEEAVRRRDQILAAVSHDLKTPLTAILGTAQMLARRAARMDHHEAKYLMEGLDRIHGAGTRMAGMMDELLDAAQLEAGEPLALRPEPTDLVALARDAAADHRHGAAGHELRVDARVPEVVGTWDCARLRRVLDNLLSNAVKYSPAGSEVVIEVYPEPAAGEADGRGWAVLRVRDRGIGIPAADLPRLFERFHRGSNTGGVPGTGVGLAGARLIVEQHGGSIEVNSREGAGSTVTLRLPL